MNEVVAIILGTGEENVNQCESTQRHYVVLQDGGAKLCHI